MGVVCQFLFKRVEIGFTIKEKFRAVMRIYIKLYADG